MMETVIQTSEYTVYKINRIQTLISKTEQIIYERKPSVVKIDIPKLFEQPYIRPKNLVSDKIKSLNTAKKYLTELEDLGLLTKSKLGKEYIWFNTALMDILSSEEWLGLADTLSASKRNWDCLGRRGLYERFTITYKRSHHFYAHRGAYFMRISARIQKSEQNKVVFLLSTKSTIR